MQIQGYWSSLVKLLKMSTASTTLYLPLTSYSLSTCFLKLPFHWITAKTWFSTISRGSHAEEKLIRFLLKPWCEESMAWMIQLWRWVVCDESICCRHWVNTLVWEEWLWVCFVTPSATRSLPAAAAACTTAAADPPAAGEEGTSQTTISGKDRYTWTPTSTLQLI